MSDKEDQAKPGVWADVRSSAWLECEDCHCKGADVEETTCPYVDELFNKLVPATLCKECYLERLKDT